jgi:Rrf2 family protein
MQGPTMRLSKRVEYGIKASIRLCGSRGTGYTQSREIADAEALPGKFLESILLALRSAGVLESKVGAGGGYRLARESTKIQVTEIVAALEREPDLEPTGQDPTSRPGQVALDLLHSRMDRAMHEALGTLSLADLAAMADDRVGGLTGVGR